MKAKLILIIALVAYVFSSCEDTLDRKPLTDADDNSYWTSEQKVRLFANEFYGRYFIGYGYKDGSNYAALKGYDFNDDFVTFGNQEEFERSIPSSKGPDDKDSDFKVTKTKNNPLWQKLYTGPTWNFGWVRKSNIMIDRINKRMGSILKEDEKAHWIGIARFFRAMEYAGLVTVFGDVPYYDKEIDAADFEELYKPRTPRNEVMDEVYNDLKFALDNVRLNDGDQFVNRYVVAGFVSRLALVEGTWQKYHYSNNERASKFLQLAIDAGELVKQSGKFDIVTDFRSLFGSPSLSGNKDCIFYRHYDNSVLVTHAVATNCNLAESRNLGPSLSLIKSFICNDGQDWQSSTMANAKDFRISELVKTRDPRFEASFWHKPTPMAKGSLMYICKFIDRNGPEYAARGEKPAIEYTSNMNTNDYPIMRYAEVLLNWIEAKAELATIGGAAVGSSDIEASINKIRNRPLDKVALDRGVTKTAPMNLVSLPDDPNRGDVPQLIWEIRRERRMELAFEHSRVIDLRRWKKLDYMDTDQHPDLLKGTWVDFPNELPEELNKASNIGVIAVSDMSGNVTVFDGNNKSKMVGFYSSPQNKGRQPFLNVTGMNPYLSPIGTNQRVEYKQRGYDLAQTEGWSSAMP